MPTIGSLCSGIAGLDMAVAHHFDADLIWMSDDNAQASEFLSVRYPDVSNIGDLRTADPATLEVPTILTMGFPCTPVSSAGLKKGTADDRWLFDDICVFIDRMSDRPEFLVIENVRNIISHDQGRTALRVVRQIAALGFDLRWGVLRASDAGLPHKRERWFAVATNPDGVGRSPWSRLCEGQPAPLRGDGPSDRSESTAPDPDRESMPKQDQWAAAGVEAPQWDDPPRSCLPVPFGPYEAAIRRWELIFGHPAPSPVDDKDRLAPAFVEWMLGFEPGYLTDVITTRTHALRLLGNSVCPPQAALALDFLTQ